MKDKRRKFCHSVVLEDFARSSSIALIIERSRVRLIWPSLCLRLIRRRVFRVFARERAENENIATALCVQRDYLSHTLNAILNMYYIHTSYINCIINFCLYLMFILDVYTICLYKYLFYINIHFNISLSLSMYFSLLKQSQLYCTINLQC